MRYAPRLRWQAVAAAAGARPSGYLHSDGVIHHQIRRVFAARQVANGVALGTQPIGYQFLIAVHGYSSAHFSRTLRLFSLSQGKTP